MAEFCVDCWNKLMNTNDPPKIFHLSRTLDYCEECRQWKRVIITVKRWYLVREWLKDLNSSHR